MEEGMRDSTKGKGVCCRDQRPESSLRHTWCKERSDSYKLSSDFHMNIHTMNKYI